MQIQRVEYQPDSFLPRHAHDDWRLIVIVRGGLIERARGGVERDCTPRTALLRSAGELHSNEIGRNGCTCVAASVSHELLGQQSGTRLGAGGRIAHLAARLAEETSSRDPFAPLAAQGIVFELLAELCRGAETRGIPAAIARGRDMLAGRCTTPLRIDEIAREAGLEPVRFARLFRRAYGCTPSDFVRAERVARACDALRAGIPLADAARRSGFYDQSHFCNVFRRVTGMTPGAWRKSIQKR